MKNWLEARWYQASPPPLLLRLLAALYGSVSASRRRKARARAQPVPVIVVGNISVGGTGKTPFVIWLVELLRAQGWRPGVISRGYGGHAPHYPYIVNEDSDPAHSGDEPLLIAQRSGCPVVVAAARCAAAELLLKAADVDVIVADDGLQHYTLSRDLEICIVDGARGLGNGALLPAGPLREPASRLREVDLVVVNGEGWSDTAVRPVTMRLLPASAQALCDGTQRALNDFSGQRVHGVAGIGHPPRFFDTLRAHGMRVVEHAFADHHAYAAADLQFGDDLPVLMTEKDAVKCRSFAAANWWSVPVAAQLSADDAARVQELIRSLRKS
ncbi:MAG: tetraacyldisaccharide 4'-kinase [Pseudomonadota bacterium]|nr:tetraacyldisaccharide 4'-kinase [Pseudomonadota bacterium]